MSWGGGEGGGGVCDTERSGERGVRWGEEGGEQTGVWWWVGMSTLTTDEAAGWGMAEKRVVRWRRGHSATITTTSTLI